MISALALSFHRHIISTTDRSKGQRNFIYLILKCKVYLSKKIILKTEQGRFDDRRSGVVILVRKTYGFKTNRGTKWN